MMPEPHDSDKSCRRKQRSIHRVQKRASTGAAPKPPPPVPGLGCLVCALARAAATASRGRSGNRLDTCQERARRQALVRRAPPPVPHAPHTAQAVVTVLHLDATGEIQSTRLFSFKSLSQGTAGPMIHAFTEQSEKNVIFLFFPRTQPPRQTQTHTDGSC